jgi:hypothetical protein
MMYMIRVQIKRHDVDGNLQWMQKSYLMNETSKISFMRMYDPTLVDIMEVEEIDVTSAARALCDIRLISHQVI